LTLQKGIVKNMLIMILRQTNNNNNTTIKQKQTNIQSLPERGIEPGTACT